MSYCRWAVYRLWLLFHRRQGKKKKKNHQLPGMEPRFTMYELTHTIYIKYNQPDGILRKPFLTEDSTLPTAIHWLTAVKFSLQTSTDSNVNGMWWQFCPELISGTLKVSMLPFQFGSSHPSPAPPFLFPHLQQLSCPYLEYVSCITLFQSVLSSTEASTLYEGITV